MQCNPWGDVPTWLAAIGTIGAVIVALCLARSDGIRREKLQRRHQAELVTAWLGSEETSGGHVRQSIVIQKSSPQSVYLLVASLVAKGGFRDTALGDARKFRATVGQVPPGRYERHVRSPGHGMHVKLAIELAFRDAAGVCWLRRGNGSLEDISEDPIALYQLPRPIGWEVG
jgi:hypothetical protein